MGVAQHQLRIAVERAINKLRCKDASWSRVLAHELHLALKTAEKERMAKLNQIEFLIIELIEGHDPEITMDVRVCLEKFDKIQSLVRELKEEMELRK